MVMGTVLTAPQRMRRTQSVDPGIALIGDILNLATRLAQDAEQGGRIAEVARGALEEALGALVRQRLGKIEAAGPRLASWLLRVLRATTGLGPEFRPDSPADALNVMRGLLDAVAGAAGSGNAATIRPYVVELLGIVQNDIGLSLPVLEAAFWQVFEAIIDRLEAIPPEANRELRENRLDTIRVLRRIRKLVRGKFPLPTLDADRIADALATELRTFDAAAVARAAQCVAHALDRIGDVAGAIAELAPLGSLSSFRTVGAAAAIATGETYCWYASWLYEEDVVINAGKTEIRRGDTVIATGIDLTVANIPDFSTATPRYTFGSVGPEAMDTLTYVMYVVADGIVILCHLVSLENGDYGSNAMNAFAGFTTGTFKAFSGGPLLPAPVEDWVLPLATSFLLSFEGIHTRAKAFPGFKMWVTLFLPDAIEAVIYKQASIIVRDLVLSLFTLINYDGAFDTSADPDPRPLNRKHIDGVAFIGEWLGGFVFMKFYPREEYAQPFASGLHALKFWLFWDLFLNNLFYVMGRLIGCMLAMSIGRSFDFDAWLEPLPLQLLLKGPLTFPVSLYMDKEGKTDGGTFNPTGLPYTGYPDKATSPYALPYVKDTTCYIVQGNQGFFSHHHLNLDQTYSYDFSLDQDAPILASRPGTVVDWFDFVADDTNPDSAEVAVAAAEAAFSGFLKPGQTTSDSWNFIAIRHDCDDAGAALPPDNAHDRAAGGAVVTTYAIYGHGRKGSVRDAFTAHGVAEVDIIGAKVKTGQRIMRTGNTGVSFNNHLHMMVQEGPAGPAVPVDRFSLKQPSLPFVFREHGVLEKLDWYTSAVEEVA